MRLLLAALFALSLCAQPKEEPKPKTPPVISKDLELKLWRTQAEATAAQLALEHSKEQDAARRTEYAREAALQEWQNFCGAEFVTTVNGDGKPVCAAKPEPPPARGPQPPVQTPPPDPKK